MGFCRRAPALTWVWHSALGGQLGQEDAKGPDVRLDSKPAVQSSFGGCPLDGELGTWMETQGEGLLLAPRCPRTQGLQVSPGAVSVPRIPTQPGPCAASRCNTHSWGLGTLEGPLLWLSPAWARCQQPWGHTLPSRVLVVLDEACQAEVSHFAHQVLPHKDVGSPEVPVDVVHPLHVGHTRCDLWGPGHAALRLVG